MFDFPVPIAVPRAAEDVHASDDPDSPHKASKGSIDLFPGTSFPTEMKSAVLSLECFAYCTVIPKDQPSGATSIYRHAKSQLEPVDVKFDPETKLIIPPPGPVFPTTHTPPSAQDAGAGAVTVNVKVCEAELVAFVAVIVYTVADCTVVGVPDNNPVDVLNDVPVGADGLIE